MEGSKTASYCKKHAAGGKVNVRHKRCSHATCTTSACLNVKGSKAPLYCKKHAEDGMVNVRAKRCSYATFIKADNSLSGRETKAYCKKHADARMVNVRNRRWVHASCTAIPSFNHEGSKRAA